MKNNFYKILTIFLSLSCLLLVIRAINLMQNRNELIENSYSNNYIVNKKDKLTMMLETEYDSNQYELATSSEWPTDGYIFNSELSACKNGSQVVWDSETNRVMVYAGSIDSCYIYFDKEPDAIYLADYIKNTVYTGDGNEGIYYHDGVGTYTNASEEAGDYSYRYSGANPNNYVCFGSDEVICPNDNLYRIIGIFGENVKLIKYDYATPDQLGTDGDYYNTYLGAQLDSSNYKGTLGVANIGTYYWNYSNGEYSYNIWSESRLNTINLNTNYISYLNEINSKWNDMIDINIWQVGGNTNSSISELAVKNGFTNEIVNPAANTTYEAKIGLMYVSDYGYAVSPDYWTTVLHYYNNQTLLDNNWMYMGLYEWTLTRVSNYNDFSYYIAHIGSVDHVGDIHTRSGIRPAFYLKSNVAITSGDGSSSNPYRLELS